MQVGAEHVVGVRAGIDVALARDWAAGPVLSGAPAGRAPLPGLLRPTGSGRKQRTMIGQNAN